MKKDIPKPVRIVLFVLGVIWIGAMWVKKDVGATLAAVPAEAAVPMIVTSLVITLLKVALFAAVIWLVRKLGGKK